MGNYFKKAMRYLCSRQLQRVDKCAIVALIWQLMNLITGQNQRFTAHTHTHPNCGIFSAQWGVCHALTHTPQHPRDPSVSPKRDRSVCVCVSDNQVKQNQRMS